MKEEAVYIDEDKGISGPALLVFDMKKKEAVLSLLEVGNYDKESARSTIPSCHIHAHTNT